MRYQVLEYQTRTGTIPFRAWLLGLKDATTKARLLARIDRAAHGNFGDWKALAGAKGLFEMRDHAGSGYRIFFTVVRGQIILLLAGSDKKNQERTIAQAQKYLADYRERTS
ncbi:MAG: type II toxin-antitoxin system RelE/ParE family toxin [Alphaproteobacteria bacterium]|nr:type II toxin-antitoxin system RelE/ParE family toxin [Alphaproteobacteria bacterium]NDC55860.1 type II toxin-antitoxin system RelE/ParE family toxin [Alphaproteobacteria bacterium]NDG04082.1 type II toxin-antitoxin system RelE/ParE family toxin [Alphaproteobacteria bacterium]